MKKRKLIIAAGLILIAGLLLYFSKAISLNTIFKAKSAESSKIQSSEHQGHTGGGISQQQTAAQEQTPEEPPTVEIPTDKQQLIGVKTVEVSVKPLQKIIRTVGRIEYDERRLFTVNTKFVRMDRKALRGLYGKICQKRRASR
ncbi:hypothetical protein [Dissulfurispira sp.]|uniref:hypothetical protein n=1 Tax=Dissulfurispira sp. TaxID=2817609 RepID=UPI002FD8B1FE